MTLPNVFDLLAATGPHIEYADKLMTYGQFVGAWDIEATYYEKDKKPRKQTGEWYFGWILGGRGVQDVLFPSKAKPYQYGTTLRCYDSLLDAWHITWMMPASGEFIHLLGRKIADRIEQEGLDKDYLRRIRWSFTNITADSFLWLGEVSLDQGATWILEEEMKAVRRKEA